MKRTLLPSAVINIEIIRVVSILKGNRIQLIFALQMGSHSAATLKRRKCKNHDFPVGDFLFPFVYNVVFRLLVISCSFCIGDSISKPVLSFFFSSKKLGALPHLDETFRCGTRTAAFFFLRRPLRQRSYRSDYLDGSN